MGDGDLICHSIGRLSRVSDLAVSQDDGRKGGNRRRPSRELWGECAGFFDRTGLTLMMRILQVVGCMNRGGAETWLMHVLRAIDQQRFQFDFLVHGTHPGAYDAEIAALGGRLVTCPSPANPLAYAHAFRRLLNECGPYDIVHSHLHHFSGFVLRLTRRAGISGRVAHSHLDSAHGDAGAPISRRAYVSVARRWIDRSATAGLACSDAAGAALFGRGWRNDPRWRVLHCGIDLVPFAAAPDREAVRRELGIPPSAFVIGHVGRFSDQKNHRFIVDVAGALAARTNDARVVLIGDGPLRTSIEEHVRRAGLTDFVIFAGAQSDIPRLMIGAFDVFLFPSHYEGVALALIEAQAAGLPIVCSDVISGETDVVTPLIHRMSLQCPPGAWADAILARRGGAAVPREAAVTLIERSHFNIRESVHRLETFYDGCCAN
jgi:glycosyltransferase involved in cell wall biosynthesis